MKIFKSEFLTIAQSLPELKLDEIYKSVAIGVYLKSSYKNIYEYVDDDNSPEDFPINEIIFMNRELFVNDDGVKVVRNYYSDLNSKILGSIKVKLFLNDLVYEKEFHCKDQLIKLLNKNQFVQEKWQLFC